MERPDDTIDLEPTREQIQALLDLGVTDLEIEGLTYTQAEELIENIQAARVPQDHPR